MKLTRREFIKTTAVLSGAVGIGLGIDGKVLKALAESAAPVAQGGEKTVLTCCPGTGCHQSCVFRTYVREGRIVKVEGADYPGEPELKHACLRGLASAWLPYMPDRLKYPMKRVGERGEGKFERISWDEALDTIATKLKDIKARYGSQAVSISAGGSTAVPGGSTSGSGGLGSRFANLFEAGSPPGGTGMDLVERIANVYIYYYDPKTRETGAYAGHDYRDVLNSRLIVIWGDNLGEARLRDFIYVLEAKDKGTRVIDISPFFNSSTAAKADQFIPIRPATDGAFALSAMDVIIKAGLYDADYVKKYSNGPFLVRSDNKKLLRESDIVAGGKPENYVVWDSVTNAPKAVAPKVQEIAGVDPALLGTYSPKGIACKPAFQLLADRAAEYAPETATKVCEVPAETIRSFALEYAKAKPACIRHSHGTSRTYHGNLSHRAIITLAVICGNIGVPGGGVSYRGGYTYEGTTREKFTRGITTATATRTKRVATREYEEPYATKAMLWFTKNPLGGDRGFRRKMEKAWPHIELLVVHDLYMTFTAKYADIVLPGTFIYERSDISTANDFVAFSEKAIEPMYECKSDVWVWTELAKRMGFGEHFTKTEEEWIEYQLDQTNPYIKGITLERLKKEGGIIRANVPKEWFVEWLDKKFKTVSGRLEFYSEALTEWGEELPLHKEPMESPLTSPLAKKYPLIFYTMRIKNFVQTMGFDPLMRELEPEPRLYMNPADAEKRGIKDGDWVIVFNDLARLKVKVRFFEGIRPGTLNLPHGWHVDDFPEGHYQDLLYADFKETPWPENPVHRLIGFATEIVYDQLVEVKKA